MHTPSLAFHINIEIVHNMHDHTNMCGERGGGVFFICFSLSLFLARSFGACALFFLLTDRPYAKRTDSYLKSISFRYFFLHFKFMIK